MSLTQADADALLAMQKRFAPSVTQIDFPLVQAFSAVYGLDGIGRQEAFLFDLERGHRKRARLKFQTRARKVYVLARIDIDGRPHTNPVGAPHRPGERFTGPHVHLYRAGYEDRVAFHPSEVPGFIVPAMPDDTDWLVGFLRLCNVNAIPPIQVAI